MNERTLRLRGGERVTVRPMTSAVMAFEIPLGRRTVAPEIAARRTLGLAS